MKNSNKELQVLIAIGGWNVGKKDMSALAADSNRRKAFAQNAITFLRNYNFDGIDMDWQFPENEDKENFVLFMKVYWERCSFNLFPVMFLKTIYKCDNYLGIKRRVFGGIRKNF